MFANKSCLKNTHTMSFKSMKIQGFDDNVLHSSFKVHVLTVLRYGIKQ